MICKLGIMMATLEVVSHHQQKATPIKEWLVNNPNADVVAIRQQRENLSITHQKIKTICNS